ncbi:unnamed protein product [Closterium sp. Naga37s-1]|nr:unnamed protein product [Closterium sp. Naga37s-1]
MTPTCPVRPLTTPSDPLTTHLRPSYDALRWSSLPRHSASRPLSPPPFAASPLSHTRSGYPAVSPAAALAVSPACSLAVCPPLSWSTFPRCRFRDPSAPAWFGCAVSSIPASQPPSPPSNSPLPLSTPRCSVLRCRPLPRAFRPGSPRALFPFLRFIPSSLRPLASPSPAFPLSSFPPPRLSPSSHQPARPCLAASFSSRDLPPVCCSFSRCLLRASLLRASLLRASLLRPSLLRASLLRTSLLRASLFRTSPLRTSSARRSSTRIAGSRSVHVISNPFHVVHHPSPPCTPLTFFSSLLSHPSSLPSPLSLPHIPPSISPTPIPP